MKFLFRSGWGESLAIARRVESEGNLVRFSVVEKTAKNVGRGLITQAKDFLGSVGWADVVVFDSNNFDMPKEAEKLRASGKNVVGSSELSGKLESDRIFATGLAEKAGLEVPYYFDFKGRAAFQQAREFLAEHGDKDEDGWVWKHNGMFDIASTFVGSAEEVLRMLNYYEGLYEQAKEVPNFVLCTCIKGCEVSTEAWFNGQEFVLANNTLEKNKLFNGDIGEKTGCAGNVVWAYEELGENKLFEKLVGPLTGALKGRYCGPVDVNALIEEGTNEPTFLEFTPRIGYDAFFALALLLPSDVGGLFADCAMGRRWAGRVESGKFGGTVRIHVPPYPDEEEGRAEGVPIFGFDPSEVDPTISPCEVMLDSMGEPVTSGPNGYVFVIGKTDDSVKGAMTIDIPVKVPQMRYRTDLAAGLQEVYDELVESGWTDKPKRRLFGR